MTRTTRETVMLEALERPIKQKNRKGDRMRNRNKKQFNSGRQGDVRGEDYAPEIET
jgi:hypothetical protein